MRYTLVVKAKSELDAIEMVQQKLGDAALHVESTRFDDKVKHCIVICTMARADLRLVNWYCATAVDANPPYPLGTLLWYQEGELDD